MTTPPLLVFATLLFWGWQTGHLVPGFLAGLALESSRYLRLRWSLSQADFNRLSNVCAVLFLGVGTFLLINEGTVTFNDFFANAGRRPEAIKQAGRSALTWFQWFPMIFLPLMLAQAFNDPPRVGLAAFSWWLRRQEAQNPSAALPREAVDISFAYIALVLLSASATADRKTFFYLAIAVLIAWALWTARSLRYRWPAWAVAFAIVAAAGYGGQQGLVRLQKKLEEMNLRWFTRWAAAGFNDREARTRLGAIGRLKNSDRIVLRLRTDGGAPPELLRETSYNAWRGITWSVAQRQFLNVPPESDGSTWKLLPRKATRQRVTIAAYFRGGKGLVPLPSGTAEIWELPAGGVETNFFGGARVDEAPGMAIYEARYGGNVTFDSAAAPEDLRLFQEIEPAVTQIARELQLHRDLSVKEATRRVGDFFATRFQYASYLTEAHAGTAQETPLARFLLHTRSGHCEYFATATTLLLRHAGVPTRYAVGYSVQEGNGSKYVVRDRHAHAWTLIWDGENWIDFDTTPASWDAAESARASWFQPVKDFFSELWFQFSRFRWGKTEWRRWAMLAPVPLLIVVLVRFFFGKQWRKMRIRQENARRLLSRAGVDSEFYRIEKYFAARGFAREQSENWSAWLRRLEQRQSAAPGLQRVLALHHRHRFDPSGLSEGERDELRDSVGAWMRAAAG